jgi:hypothetical protein
MRGIANSSNDLPVVDLKLTFLFIHQKSDWNADFVPNLSQLTAILGVS